MVDLVLQGQAPLAVGVDLGTEKADARAFAAASRSPRTLEAYEAQWRAFEAWCLERELRALPASPDTVALHLSGMATRKLAVASIELRLVAISQVHKAKGHPSPRDAVIVQTVRAGIRRTLGTRQKQKAPLLGRDLKSTLVGAGPSAPGQTELSALRDRALLLLGWHAALRRSELVAVEVPHVRFVHQGLELLIPRSKTDQGGAGRTVPIPRGRTEELCPEQLLRAWLAASAITTGTVFRGVDRWGHVRTTGMCGRTVARIVKRVARAAGLDGDDFGGHSLRAGLVTDAARQGRGEAAIMAITGHVSVTMLRRYIREADRWRNLANEGLLE